MPEGAPALLRAENAGWAERFAEDGIDPGDDTTGAEWLSAAFDWATEDWSGALPEFPGSTGLAGGVLLMVAVLLVVSVIWLGWTHRKKRTATPAPEPDIALLPVLESGQLQAVLRAALANGELDKALATVWLVVEHQLDASGHLERRADRSAYALVRDARAAHPGWNGLVQLHALADRYVRLRYGAADPSSDAVHQLAGDALDFTEALVPAGQAA